MWARLVVAPWWALWLVNAATFTVTLVAICVLGISALRPPAGRGRCWRCPGFSVVVTGLMTLARRPIQQSYARTVTGLNLSQRSQAVRALRRDDEVPADPAVLAAAVRIGNLSMAYRRRVPRWQKRLAWCVPVLWVIAGVLAFVGDNARGGLTWRCVGAVDRGSIAVGNAQSASVAGSLELLRSAADSQPASIRAGRGARFRRAAAKPAVSHCLCGFVAVAVAAMIAVYQQARPSRDCRTADAVVGFIHAHPDMLDSTLITPGGPGLDKYQDWSDRLVAYSDRRQRPISHRTCTASPGSPQVRLRW